MLVTSSVEQIKTPTAIALGNFDGIHQGHRLVLRSIKDSGSVEQIANACPSVVSFIPHPREFFTGTKLQLLTPVEQKAELLSDLGIEQLILLPFNQALAELSPQQFVAQILVQQLKAVSISVGTDFRFGYQRQGTGEDLQQIGAGYGISVKLNPLHKYGDRQNQQVRVSSSLIRRALTAGDMETANFMLDRAYCLWGTVVTGQQLGRTIGFPTANLKLPEEKFLPRFGVYAVNVLLEQTTVKGVMNIGCRPTVAGESPTIEVHLLNWSGDLYGKTLKVELLRYLRPEQKFDSVEALKQQITQDCQSVLNN
ncbi:MAG: bifunctional riboflavin kinase/FAD synthetase [Cyanobacteria bacterium P01_C01_bin.72]